GGLLWLLARGRLWLFAILYLGAWGLVQVTAPLAGRVALPCSGEVLRMQSVVYCALMRNFVTPELRDVAVEAAEAVAREHPGTVTLALDGGFPFLDGFPLIPHLSHDDGEKLDFAFYYAGEGGYRPGRTASPIGYFAFETVGEEEVCPPTWLTMRWGMGWFRPLLRPLELEPLRTTALIRAVLADARVGKVFVEPPLAARLGVADARLRFQGCRAARHDDHIHIQLQGDVG
ncbi:MAG: hypothetical protein ACRC14_20160, partial [Paracoccaceae bacterium]